MSLKVKINGKAYEAENGEYILEVCRRNSIFVPSLCHHESLSGLGTCRLCVVEANEGNGKKVVVSCVYPLSQDCEVFTESEKIKSIRRTILSMLRTKAPKGDGLDSLCQMYGVEEDRRFTVSGAKGRLAEACVLCGLCAQSCANLGTGAISAVGCGVVKKISTPYDEPSADCIGCGSCAAVCPTQAIECAETGDERSIWGRKFALLACVSCGRAFAAREEYAFALKRAAQEKAAPAKADSPPQDASSSESAESAPLCDTCRRKKSAGVFAAAFGVRA